MQDYSTLIIISAIIITALVFLLIREVLLWYWKINMIVKKLEMILEQLIKHNNFHGG